MSLILSERKSILQGLASLMIISSMHLKHGSPSPDNKIPADILFYVGWILYVWALGTRGDNKTVVPNKLALAGLCVGALLLSIRMLRDEKQKENEKLWKGVFCSSWVGLGVLIAFDKDWSNRVLALAGASLGLYATIRTIPQARVSGNSDHPGYSMLAAGLGGMLLGNTLKAM